MYNKTSDSDLPVIEIGSLEQVRGGDFGGSVDWVNFGGGVATGFCALGPFAKHCLDYTMEKIKGPPAARRVR